MFDDRSWRATFAGSTLFNLMESNMFNVPKSANLPNTNIKLPNFLIGDEAYPLKPYLMRPYPKRALNPQKEHFNKCLSSARKCIECAFGIMCAKWRFLNKDIETLPDKACILIKCACILHNLIREKDGDSDLHYCGVMQQMSLRLDSTDQPASVGRTHNRGSTTAIEIREELASYLFHWPL